MKTANDLAQAAIQIGQLADRMKPAETDPYAQARKLIQYHLISAASKTRQLAEAIAAKDATA